MIFKYTVGKPYPIIAKNLAICIIYEASINLWCDLTTLGYRWHVTRDTWPPPPHPPAPPPPAWRPGRLCSPRRSSPPASPLLECVGCLSKLLNFEFFNIYLLSALWYSWHLSKTSRYILILVFAFFPWCPDVDWAPAWADPDPDSHSGGRGESFCLIATSHVDNLTPSSDFCRYLSWQGQHPMDKLKGKILLENIFQCGNFFLCGLQKFVPLCVTFGDYNCSSASHLKLETFSLSH